MLNVEWLGIVFLILCVIFFIDEPLRKHSKGAWEDMKKAEGTSPEAKIETYAKGFSKQFADGLVQAPETKYSVKGISHKTPNMAKNFFTELKDLFGMK